MANYDIPLDLANPKGPIDSELAHIIAHFTNEGLTVTAFTIQTAPSLRLRIVSPGEPSASIQTHFKVEGSVQPNGGGK